MKRLFAVLLCIVLFSSMTCAYAEEPASLQLFGSRQNGRTLDILLYAGGSAALTAGDVSVTVSGTPVPVTNVLPLSRSGEYSTSWIVIVEPAAYESISAAVHSLIETLTSTLGERDNIAVLNGVTGKRTAFVRDTATIMPFVDSAVREKGGVRLYDSVSAAMACFAGDPSVNARRCLLVISEGIDTDSSFTLASAAEQAERNASAVYCVGITRGVDTYREAFRDLQTLSDTVPGGMAFALEDFPEGTGASAADRIRENEKCCYAVSADLSGLFDGGAENAVVSVSLNAPGVWAGQTDELVIGAIPAAEHVHTWQEATCQRPRTCSSCLATEGEPVDHVYGEDGLCIWCGEPENAALYWIRTNLALCIATAAAVLLVIVMLIVVTSKKRRLRKDREEAARAAESAAAGGNSSPAATQMAAKVTVELTNRHSGQKYSGRIFDATIKAGRAAELNLPGDPSISHNHMEFVWQNGILYVQDSNSRNGTWVNGSRISGAVALHQSDIIHAGDSDFIVNWHGV